MSKTNGHDRTRDLKQFAVGPLGLIEASSLASALGVSLKFIQRRMADPEHPQFIPNISVGRKRFVKEADLYVWLDQQKLTR